MTYVIDGSRSSEKLFKNIVMAGLFLSVFVPLMVIKQAVYPTITVKAFAFRIIVEVHFITWIVLASLHTEYRPKKSEILIGLSVTVLISLIADILGVNPLKSFWSDLSRMQGWIQLIHLWAFFIVMISMFKNNVWWIRYFNTSVFVAILISGFSFLQIKCPQQFHFSSSGRIDGLFGNSSYLSIYLLLNMFISAFLLFDPECKPRKKSLYAICIFIMFLPLLFTGTRGTMLGLFFGLIVTGVLCAVNDRKNDRIRKIVVIILVILIGSMSCLYFIKEKAFVKENIFLSRTASLFNKNVGADRFHIWNMAVKGIIERPILGWGQENFNFIFNKYYTPEFAQEEWFDRTHNVFLEWMVTGGILLFLSNVILYGIVFRSIWKGTDKITGIQKSVLTGMLIAHLIHNSFIFDHLQSYIIFFAILAYTHYLSKYENCSGNDRKLKPIILKGKKEITSGNLVCKPNGGNTSLCIITIVCIICIGLVAYPIVIKPSLANYAMYQAINATGGKEKLHKYKKALEYNTAYAQDILIALGGDTVKIISASNVNETEDIKKYIKDQWIQQVIATPNDPKPYIFLSIFLAEIGWLDEAEVYARKAAELSPNKQSFLFNLGQICFSNKKYDEAYQVYKKAYELNSDLNLDYAIRSYAKISIFIGRGNEVYEIVKPYMKEQNIDQSVVGAFLASDANKALMVDFYERIKQEDPNNMITRVYLVNAYAHVDEKKKAYSEIEEMKRDFPQIRKELDNLATEVYRFKPVSGAPATEGSPPLIEKYVPKKVESDF